MNYKDFDCFQEIKNKVESYVSSLFLMLSNAAELQIIVDTIKKDKQGIIKSIKASILINLMIAEGRMGISEYVDCDDNTKFKKDTEENINALKALCDNENGVLDDLIKEIIIAFVKKCYDIEIK